MQSTLRSRGNYALYDPKIADMLGITEEQKKEIRSKAMEAQKKLNAEMMRLRQEMQEKLLDEVLTAAQKRKIKELTGDKYEMKPIEYTDRKSTRLNSSHKPISYAVFCLKKKKFQ